MGHSGPAHSAMTRPLTIASLREAALAEMRQTQASEPPTHYLHGAGQSLRSTDSEPMPYFSYLAGGPSSYVGPGALDAPRDMSRWGPDMAAMVSRHQHHGSGNLSIHHEDFRLSLARPLVPHFDAFASVLHNLVNWSLIDTHE